MIFDMICSFRVDKLVAIIEREYIMPNRPNQSISQYI